MSNFFPSNYMSQRLKKNVFNPSFGNIFILKSICRLRIFITGLPKGSGRGTRGCPGLWNCSHVHVIVMLVGEEMTIACIRFSKGFMIPPSPPSKKPVLRIMRGVEKWLVDVCIPGEDSCRWYKWLPVASSPNSLNKRGWGQKKIILFRNLQIIPWKKCWLMKNKLEELVFMRTEGWLTPWFCLYEQYVGSWQTLGLGSSRDYIYIIHSFDLFNNVELILLGPFL